MTTSPRKPLPIRITEHVYIDAWRISDIRDEVLFMTDGGYFENVAPAVVHRSLIGVQQIGGECPALIRVGCDYVVAQHVRAFSRANGSEWVEMASGNTYALSDTQARDLFDSWCANSQHGMVHGAR